MVRRAALFLLLAAAPFGANPASAQGNAPADWAMGELPNGCMVQSVSPQGTMLSLWGFAGQTRFGVLLQNRQWGRLRDGQRYALSLEFVGHRAWPVQATAREHIDADGPGFFFTLAPGGGGGDFLDALTSAKGMHISRDGQRVDTLPLAGSRAAISALARCLAERWGGPEPAEAGDAAQTPEASSI